VNPAGLEFLLIFLALVGLPVLSMLVLIEYTERKRNLR
jgi:hypothetical protein